MKKYKKKNRYADAPTCSSQNPSSKSDFLNYSRKLDQGLDNSAILGRCEITQGGIIYKRPMINIEKRKKSYVKRGKIRGFSAKSKRRMLEKMMRIDWTGITGSKHAESAKSVFMTLTYPCAYSQFWGEWKADIKSLRKRIERKYGVISAVWKLEFQKRGAPHFHVLLIFDKEMNVSRLRNFISSAWYQVVNSEDEKHLKAGTRIDRVHGETGKLMRYLGKYLGKKYECEQDTGRVWGVWGVLPIGVYKAVSVDGPIFLRRIRKWGRKSPYLRNMKHVYGALIFGISEDILRGIIIDAGDPFESKVREQLLSKGVASRPPESLPSVMG